MAKNIISDFDSAAANNTDIGGINIDEGMLPSNVNNAFRELMSQIKTFQDGTDGVDLIIGGDFTVTTGDTASRPVSPSQGMLRFNTTTGSFEGYDGTYWSPVGGGATGAGGDQVFVENGTEVTTNYTLTTGKNALSVGEITINSGVTVTIPSGQRWVII